MTHGGGIIYDTVISKNEKEAYTHFCSNATFVPLGYGTYGCTVRAVLKNGVESPFKSIRYETYMKPVTELLIKFSHISDLPDKTMIDKPIIAPIESVELVSEVNTQIDVHFKTMNYLQPLCPAVVFSEVTKDMQVPVAVLNDILATTPSGGVYNIKTRYKIDEMNLDKTEKHIFTALDKIVKNVRRKGVAFGIVAMELANGYTTLYKLYNDEKKLKKAEELRMIHRYAIIEMAVKCGYSHADFHGGNFMMKLTDGKYFSNSPISFYIIDFGNSVKIPQESLTRIRDHYDKKEYCQALQLIMKHYNPDAFNPCQMNYSGTDYKYPQYYMCYNSQNKYTMRNAQIDLLVHSRETQIDANIREFEQMRAKNTNASVEYPMLPVSNNLKNKMYMGMFLQTPATPIASHGIKPYTSTGALNDENAFFAENLGNMYNVHVKTAEADNDSTRELDGAQESQPMAGGRRRMRTRHRQNRQHTRRGKQCSCKRPWRRRSRRRRHSRRRRRSHRSRRH